MIDIENQFGHVIYEKVFRKIQDKIIYQAPDGTYDLFGIYFIKKIDRKMYHLTVNRKFTQHKFYSLKNAVAWCIFDKQNKVMASNRILEIDRKLQGIDSSIDLHRQLIRKSTSQEQKLIALAKLTDEKVKKLEISKELTSYIDESKQWQERRFADNNL